MSFAHYTGKSRIQKCFVCGTKVKHEEERIFDMPKEIILWCAVTHRAPCGAYCCGGKVSANEPDVHIPTFGVCPRCGAKKTEIAKIINSADGKERIVFHRYTVAWCKVGFRIDLEKLKEGQWRVESRLNTKFPDSLIDTIEWAKHYFPWIKEEWPADKQNDDLKGEENLRNLCNE